MTLRKGEREALMGLNSGVRQRGGSTLKCNHSGHVFPGGTASPLSECQVP